MDPKKPRLRPLDIFMEEMDGRTVVCLRDPEGLSDQVAALEPALAQFLFERLDGSRTEAEVAAELDELSGGRVDLPALLAQLDKALFLESPRYVARRNAVLTAYRNEPHRPPVSAGFSYPADPDEAAGFLDSLYEGVAAEPRGEIDALAIPHLDLRYGGRAAAAGLAGLAERFTGETVIVLGVGHHLARMPFALTGKSFDTPIGIVPVDAGLVERVTVKAGSWVLDEELIHRGEHSIEFAALLLRHVLPDRDFRILPVLCGSFHPFLAAGVDPAEDALVGAFLETLREEAEDALVLASVDLAHMGPHYGDDRPLADEDKEGIGREDGEMLDLLAARDSAGFLRHFAEGGDDRRVCGMSALYSLLAIRPEGPAGRLLAYEQPVFPDEGSTVTICSMEWEAEPVS